MKFYGNNSNLFENVFALFIFQGSSYLIPLITLPYLVRVLGPERFGLLAFAQAFMQYFIVLTDYGFTLTATRKVAICKNDPAQLSAIFSVVMVIKGFFTILAFVILSVVVLLFNKFSSEWELYYLTFSMVIGSVLFPAWFFQGVENTKDIIFPNLIARIFAVVLIFILIEKESDYVLASFVQSIGFVLSGVFGIMILTSKYDIKYIPPSRNEVLLFVKDGFHVFLSTSATSLYTATNVFLLGIFATNTIVAYYSAAEKIIRAILGSLTPITQAIYPHINALAAKSRGSALHFIRSAIKYMGAFTIILSLLLFVFAGKLVSVVLGPKYVESTSIVHLMAFLPFIVSMGNIFGVQTMLTFGYSRDFSKIVVSAGIVNIVILFPLVIYYKARGVAIAYLFTELFITTMFILFVFRERLYVKNPSIP